MKYIKIGGAYQIKEDFTFQTIIHGFDIICDQYRLTPDGELCIKRYYTWDGPTGGINTRTFIFGSLIHDILCELINKGFLPITVQCMADEQMAIINRTVQCWEGKQQQMNPLRRLWVYMGVRYYQFRKRKVFTPKVYEILLIGQAHKIVRSSSNKIKFTK